jgi:DNA-binding NtrC family response regulator
VRLPASDTGQGAGGARNRAGGPALIGQSPQILAVLGQIEKIGRSAASVLILGETGSGKELAARAIHAWSDRHAGPFLAVNCGAVPDGLIETELFGHGRGAFTDARDARAGVIAHAEGGTLFLDEIDALSPKAQVTLLRFLQDLRYRPVGTATEIASDVRIIAATNQDLRRLIDDGRFRSDLLYRLNILGLRIPPLRYRRADIEPLADHFIRVFSDKYGVPFKRLHPETLEWLERHDWPGNVRELENWIHRKLLFAEGDEIRLVAGGYSDTELDDDLAAAAEHLRAACPDLRTAKARALAEVETTYLSRALAESQGNVTRAARMAGKERRTFGRLMKKYGIDRARFRA